ncbi:DUF6253 family protein [Streptomyces broussonetiae]|uniref:DUF6253 family protein n=1 Tax=Streptomyces broussonetiae TaxID=2686304 RepID=A0ABV5EDK7_9ACTN
MTMLPAEGYLALFGTLEEGTRSLPLVCWRDDGRTVHGLVLHRGALRRAEHLPGFRRYARANETAPAREEPARYADALC